LVSAHPRPFEAEEELPIPMLKQTSGRDSSPNLYEDEMPMKTMDLMNLAAKPTSI